jgi:hypothetical protein
MFKFFDGTRRKNAKSVDIEQMAKAIQGDIAMAKTADETSAHLAVAAAWTRDIQFRLVDAAGNTHEWYNATGYTLTVTPYAGTITLTPAAGANGVFVNGVCKVHLAGNSASSVAGANTVVITAKAVSGITPSGANLTYTLTFS